MECVMIVRGKITRTFVFGVFVLLPLVVAFAEDKYAKSKEPVFPEVQPDHALVYFARPDFTRLIPEFTFKVFVDSTPTGWLPQRSYMAAQVDPGSRVVWGSVGDAKRVDFQAGKIYLLVLVEQYGYPNRAVVGGSWESGNPAYVRTFVADKKLSYVKANEESLAKLREEGAKKFGKEEDRAPEVHAAALPVTFENVRYRTGKRGFAWKAYDASGTLTVSGETIEYKSDKENLAIPVKDVKSVSLEKFTGFVDSGDDSQWGMVEFSKAGTEEVVAFRGGHDSRRTPDTERIFLTLQSAIQSSTASQPAQPTASAPQPMAISSPHPAPSVSPQPEAAAPPSAKEQPNVKPGESNESQQYKRRSPPVTYERLLSVTFATPLSGWVVGTNGAIVHTEDGGQTWKKQASATGEMLNSVAFATPQSGWAVGTKGAIVHTEDGGKNWKPQASGTNDELDAVAFATPRSGWAVGKGTIIHTEDGGQNWSPEPLTTHPWLYSVSFATPQSGGAVGDGPTIVHTEDGGQNWNTQKSATLPMLSSVAFATPRSGWAVGSAGTIIHTEDGGQTWTAQTSGTEGELNSVVFVTPQSGWVVGGLGKIVHTEDGGQTWKTQTSGSQAWLTSVAFATPQLGWAVGHNGAILHTEDGGQVWAIVSEAPEQKPPPDSETGRVANPSSLAPSPKVETGEINENKRYKSGGGMFTVTVPAARNPFFGRTYKFYAARMKQGTADYEEVVFDIPDFGQAYGAGVHRIPPVVQAEMAKEEPKQTLSTLADKTIYSLRKYAEEPKTVEESAVQTQFGEGMLRIYVAGHSSILVRVTGTDANGKRVGESADARIAVLVAKTAGSYIYATAEDESPMPGATPLDLPKQLQSFFASMQLPEQSAPTPAPSESQSSATSAPQTTPAETGLPEGFVLYEGSKEQFTIAIPNDWKAYDQGQMMRAQGMKSGNFDMIRFLPAKDFESTTFGGDAIKADTGEVPTFFVQKLPADKGMSCTSLTENAKKKLVDIIGRDREFKGKSALEPAHGELAIVGGCQGLRVRAKGQPAGGSPVSADAYMVSDGQTIYIFSLRNRAEFFDKNEETFQRAVSTIKLSAAK